ncbi:MAG TPA: hypothetical protein VHX38_15230 [Pseudonocardiaceae bacterium]|nr:hypothetical protein [Pseudonocardiaceae bacterium]
MISRKNLDDLTEDYKKALVLVHEAATILEEASVTAEAVSPEFARHSGMLIRDAEMVYRFINSSLARLHRTTPDT